MRVTIHQPQFMPWLGYLDKIDQADLFVVLDSVQFKKNEWQNRNRIRTAQGWQWITVPVLHKFGQRLDEVRINQQRDWQGRHLRALEMHYGRAPYRDQYLGGLREIYRRRAVLGETLRRSVQEIEDGEFKVIETTPTKGNAT